MNEANVPATREDFEALAGDLRGLNRMLAALIHTLTQPAQSAASGNMTVHFGAGGLALWACVTAAIVSTIVCMILTILFAAAFLFFAAQDNWAAQEVTAIRSYITNGKLQPMKPRPGFNESIAQPEKSP